MKHQFLNVLALVLGLACILSSCGGSSNEKKYIVVKTAGSEMWSIMDVETGSLVHQDEFVNCPSVVWGEVFWVENAEGKYDVFKVGDVKKPINSEPYKYISPFDEKGYAVAVKPGQPLTIIDDNCKEIAVLPNNIVRAENFVNGYSIIEDNKGLRGFMNHKGNIVIEPKYDLAYNFYDEVAIVGYKNYDYVNKDVATDITTAATPSENPSDIITNYVVIDTKGNELFKFSRGDYYKFGSFREGYMPVISDEYVYLVDKQGNKSIQLGKESVFSLANIDIQNGLVSFSDGSLDGLKNIKGELQIRPKYGILEAMPNGLYLAKKQGLCGIINKNDEVIVPFERRSIFYINSERYLFGNDELEIANLVDQSGKDVGKYNIIQFSSEGDCNTIISSDYFDIDYAVEKIMSIVGTDHIGRAKNGMKLGKFIDLVSGYTSLDLETNYVKEKVNGLDVSYTFRSNLAHYIYNNDTFWMSFSGEKEYDYENEVIAGLITYSVEQYEPDAEINLTKAIEAKLSSIGFHYYAYGIYKNYLGYCLNVGYDKGVVRILYTFSDNDDPMPRNGR